jgi:hypothetical protein
MSNKFLQLLTFATSRFKEKSTFIENNLIITGMVKVHYSIPMKHILHVGICPHNHAGVRGHSGTIVQKL